jgi:hypothetical protein
VITSFDSIPHSHLREILDQRVTDGVIRRMIDKWLNAGVLEAGNLHFANRHQPVREQRAWLSAALNGHFAYFGITGNIRQLQAYSFQVVRTWHKWLERRTRGKKCLWDKFNAFLTRHPLPTARITHRYTGWNETLP